MKCVFLASVERVIDRRNIQELGICEVLQASPLVRAKGLIHQIQTRQRASAVGPTTLGAISRPKPVRPSFGLMLRRRLCL